MTLPKSILDHPRIAQWLRVEPSGAVRVRTGRVELGQGNATALVQIAADELDVAPERIVLVAGDTRETPDEGFTAGSLSIEVGGVAIRLAASAARALFLAEAAKLLQTRPERLAVADGAILLDGRPTDLGYGALAGAVDLDRPVADHARPKAPAERRLAGRPMARLDLPAKVRGGGFVHDLDLPGMLHGRVLHPPSPSARLLSLDAAALAREAGVVAVVRDGSFLGIVAEREEQAVAAVAAAARRATWSAAPPVPADPLAAIAASAGPVLVFADQGDVAAAAGRRLSTTVTRPYIAHASLAPSCAVALAEGDRLRVWSHAQGAGPLQRALAEVLRLPPERIDVVHAHGAGCYGHNGADDAALDAALLARAVPGRPVRVVWSRADELASAPLGTAQRVTASVVLGADDRIQAWELDAAGQTFGNRPGRNGRPNLLAGDHLESAAAAPAPPSDVPDGIARNGVPLYAVPSLRVTKRIVTELPYRTSSLRGLGAFLNVYAIETLMDDVAHEVGADPVAYRLRHLEDPRARRVIEAAAEAAGWPGRPTPETALGLAFARYKNTAAYCAVVAEVTLGETVRFARAWAAIDCGEAVNPDGVANQVEGAIVQSASWTLKEAVRFDGEAVASRDWASYPILTFSEAPEIGVAIVGRPEDPPLGVGEAATGPTAAALSNAVRRALGVRVRDLPLTPDAIVRAAG